MRMGTRSAGCISGRGVFCSRGGSCGLRHKLVGGSIRFGQSNCSARIRLWVDVRLESHVRHALFPIIVRHLLAGVSRMETKEKGTHYVSNPH